jgi:hypothetical protein
MVLVLILFFATNVFFNQTRRVKTKFEIAKANQEKRIYSLNNHYYCW